MYALSEAKRRMLTEQLFSETLRGNPLLSNRSVWRRYRLVNTERWHFKNVVLIGDALGSAHPSIGSGTRLAMEDAIALWQSFLAEGDKIEKAFEHYQAERAPI